MEGLIFLGLVFLASGIHTYKRGIRLKKCTAKAEGTVTALSPRAVNKKTNSALVFYADIAFWAGGAEYKYSGARRTSKAKGHPFFVSVGDNVTLLYNPEDPAQCCLPGQSSATIKGAWFLLAMSAAFFIMLIVLAAIL